MYVTNLLKNIANKVRAEFLVADRCMRQTNNSMATSIPLAPVAFSVRPDPRIKNPVNCNPAPVVVKQEPVNDNPVPSDRKGSGGLFFCCFLSPELIFSVTGVVEPPVAPFLPAQGTEFHSIPRPIPVCGGAGSTVNVPAIGFLPCKRREPHDSLDPRASKAPCGNEQGSSFDVFNSAIKDISVAYDQERQKTKEKHQDDLNNMDAKHALGVEKVKADWMEGVRVLRAECADEREKHSALAKRYEELRTRQTRELESYNRQLSTGKASAAKELESYNRQISTGKATAEAGCLKQIEQIVKGHEADKKAWQILDARRMAEIETTNRWRREDLRRVEQQLDDRQTKLNEQLVSHSELAAAQLSKTYDKRVEAIQAQCESECRIKLAEQKAEFNGRVAELEAQLAAKHQDVALCDEIRKSNELMPRLLDGIAHAAPELAGFRNNVAEIMARAQDMHNHAIRMQGFMSGWQMGMPRAPPMQAPMFYPSPQGPPPVSGGPGRRGAFNTEPGPHQGQP
jgi:hypothetical protein